MSSNTVALAVAVAVAVDSPLLDGVVSYVFLGVSVAVSFSAGDDNRRIDELE